MLVYSKSSKIFLIFKPEVLKAWGLLNPSFSWKRNHSRPNHYWPIWLSCSHRRGCWDRSKWSASAIQGTSLKTHLESLALEGSHCTHNIEGSRQIWRGCVTKREGWLAELMNTCQRNFLALKVCFCQLRLAFHRHIGQFIICLSILKNIIRTIKLYILYVMTTCVMVLV